MTTTNAASKHCYCPQVGLPKVLVATPGCSNDDAAVAALPEELEVRRSGPILANYLKDRERNHKKLLEDLADGATVINHNIDAKVQELAEQLLSHIKQNEKDMYCVVENCDNGEHSLTVEIRNNALKQINNLYNKRLDDISSFRKDALKLEKERADGLRGLLQQQFQRFVAVGHKTPKDMLHDFDERIYGINQQLLSNIRAYGELDTQLRAQAVDNVVKVKSRLNQLCLGIARAYRTRSAQRHSRTTLKEEFVNQSRRSVSVSDKQRSSISSESCKERSIDIILGNVIEIDKCVNELVEAYRQAVLKVLTGFTGKFMDLHENLANYVVDETWWTTESGQLQEMIERALRGLSNSFYRRVSASNAEMSELIPNDVLNMKKSLWSLGERLRDTYALLNDAGHLCDAHMMRSALAQKLTMAAVEDLLSNNDSIEQVNEVTFNLALEQMCSAPDTEKLNHQYETLLSTLNYIESIYEQHRQAEIGRLEEFMNLPQVMANTLISEFANYLEKHPRSAVTINNNSILNINNVSPTATPRRDSSRSLKAPVPRAILQTELHEAALINWRNGFLETFESNMSLVPEELFRQARQWVDERTAILHMRYSVKLSSHSVRKERVKAAYDKRLHELLHHESRLQSHLDAIYSLVDGLPEEVSEFLKMEAPVLFPLSKWVKRIDDDMQLVLTNPDVDPEVKRLKMLSYAPRLSKYRQLFEKSLDEAISLYKRHVEQKIQEARISNVRFMGKIKLFGEGGNYAAVEATKTSATLVKGAEALEVCESRAMDAIVSRRAQLLALADQELLPLQKTVEEILKATGKIHGLHRDGQHSKKNLKK